MSVVCTVLCSVDPGLPVHAWQAVKKLQTCIKEASEECDKLVDLKHSRVSYVSNQSQQNDEEQESELRVRLSLLHEYAVQVKMLQNFKEVSMCAQLALRQLQCVR